MGPGPMLAAFVWHQSLLYGCIVQVVASFVAFVLQEGAARLAIVSGAGLGQAMRLHLGSKDRPTETPIVCTLVAAGVMVGNSAYAANNIVGAVAALYALGMPSTAALRALASVGTGLVTAGVLLGGDMDLTSRGLGAIVLLMICLFLGSVVATGIDGEDLAKGLLPNFPPGNGSVTVLAMVATTAIPFNSFLASSAADGHALGDMKRGVAFSTAMAGLLSFFVVATGAGVNRGDDDNSFTIESLSNTLKETEGAFAGLMFGGGLYAAAFSSALAVALGASLTLQSLLAHHHGPQRLPQGPAVAGVTDRPGEECPTTVANPVVAHAGGPRAGAASSRTRSDSQEALSTESQTAAVAEASNAPPSGQLASQQPVARTKRHKEFGPWSDDGVYYRGVMLFVCAVGVGVGASGTDTIVVVFAAQVVNGLLLPVIASCLLVCLNDVSLMREKPISAWDNVRLFGAVGVTFFLAAHTVCTNVWLCSLLSHL